MSTYIRAVVAAKAIAHKYGIPYTVLVLRQCCAGQVGQARVRMEQEL